MCSYIYIEILKTYAIWDTLLHRHTPDSDTTDVAIILSFSFTILLYWYLADQ